MYRFQQKQMLQMQQMRDEEERERRLQNEARPDLLSLEEQATLQAKYLEQPAKLLNPTPYHLKKTVSMASGSDTSQTTSSGPNGRNRSQINKLKAVPNIKQEGIQLLGANGAAMDDIFIPQQDSFVRQLLNGEFYSHETSDLGDNDYTTGPSSITSSPQALPSHDVSSFLDFDSSGIMDEDIRSNAPDSTSPLGKITNYGQQFAADGILPESLSTGAPSESWVPRQAVSAPTATLQSQSSPQQQQPQQQLQLPKSVPFKFHFAPVATPAPAPMFTPSPTVKIEIQPNSPDSTPGATPTNLPLSHEEAWIVEKRRRRRESHNAVERRRRDNINDRIAELSLLVPDCVEENQSHQKPNKGIVLRKSADYIRFLQETNRKLQRQLMIANGQIPSDHNNGANHAANGLVDLSSMNDDDFLSSSPSNPNL